MSAPFLPPRPNLDQLKRQAKELLDEWRSARSTEQPLRLRDAQRAIAERYGFASWDALSEHVQRASGTAEASPPRRRGMDYDDPIPGVVEVTERITRETAARLAADGATGVKIGAGTPAADLAHLVGILSLQRVDLSGRDDLTDDDVAFLASMPWLTAVSVAGCRRLTDAAARHLRGHVQLEQVNMQWTALGDDAIAALSGTTQLRRLVVGGRLSDNGAARLRDIPGLSLPSAADSFLSISSARTLTDVALEHIGALQGIAALDVHMSVFGSPYYTARGVSHLRGMAALQELNFHGNLATDDVLREIARIPRLRNLHCQDIVSGDEGFVALGRCTTLESLGARTCVRLGTRGLAAIARLPRLTNLSAGSPGLTDEGWAPIAEAAALLDLHPVQSRDGAFAHIAKAPRLERITNMYNRAIGDGATRHLRGHERLTHYSAFGTQITDESLRILADMPRLESLGFENCAWISDEGLRALARAPRLRRVTVWSCKRVDGGWLDAMPSGVDATSEAGPPGQVDGYRAETLLDYPDMPVPADVPRLQSSSPSRSSLASLVPMGLRASWVDDGLELSLDAGIDPRWVSAITEHAVRVPFSVELLARPLTMVKLGFGGHNRFVGFDEHGALVNLAPWFMKTEAQSGRRHDPAVLPAFAQDEWVRVVLDVDPRAARLMVDGALRHSWTGDFGGLALRIGIGVPAAGALTLREFRVRTG